MTVAGRPPHGFWSARPCRTASDTILAFACEGKESNGGGKSRGLDNRAAGRTIPRIIAAWALVAIALTSAAQSVDDSAAIAEIEGRLAYEAALQFAADGDYDDAAGRLRWIVSQTPATEWTTRAVAKLVEVETLRDAPEALSGSTRAALVTFGMAFTTWLGVGSLIVSEAGDAEVLGLTLLAGPIVGLTYSLRATRDTSLSDGQASLVNLGGVWGIWQGTGAAIAANGSDKETTAASMAGGVVGLALSRAIVAGRTVSSGDASLITAAGAWGTWLTLCGVLAADVDHTGVATTSVMFGGDAALLAAAVAGPSGISRARVRLINAGGMVGALYGWG
ncbi:hypothetical protein HN937_00415, partial [Candidatus Poribacteria bacterium]|nr:hypothetical protein [Candidatus Poribacteria bacterium]